MIDKEDAVKLTYWTYVYNVIMGMFHRIRFAGKIKRVRCTSSTYLAAIVRHGQY